MVASSTCSNELQTNWRNVRAISLFTFVDSLQFSFYMWSFWPYIQQIDPTMGTTFVGIIMAISGVGEAVAAPIFGMWSNRIGRILPPVYASMVMSTIGNVLYLILGAFSAALIPWVLILSRFLSGAGSGNRGCFRALVAANSQGRDRAKALASSGGAALVGLTIGPSVQVLFTWMGSEGHRVGPILLSQYTAPALLALILNALTTVYLHYKVDDCLDPYGQDVNLSKTESKAVIVKSEEVHPDSDAESAAPAKIVLRMDVVAVVICMGTRAIRMLVTANMESIGAPFTEIMFGFSHAEALEWNSYGQTAVGALTIATFLVYAFTDYTKRISERANCIGALIGLAAFYTLTMPWPFLGGSVDCTPFVGNGTHGWQWCETLAPINRWLYYITYALFYGIALSVLNNSLQALYSRVLGSGPQGTMQGVNQAVGSISRIIGPLVMSSTFSEWGPRATWGCVLILLALTLLSWFGAYRRLVPLELRKPRPSAIVPIHLAPKEVSV